MRFDLLIQSVVKQLVPLVFSRYIKRLNFQSRHHETIIWRDTNKLSIYISFSTDKLCATLTMRGLSGVI